MDYISRTKMNGKKLLILALIVRLGNCGLLRKPKVYNALITTDQNLTPSRSYPVIQPHIHETALSYASYPSYAGLPSNAYNSFGHYDPYGYSQFGANQLGYHGHGSFADPSALYPGLVASHPTDNSQERSIPNSSSSEESDESLSNEAVTESDTTANPSTDAPPANEIKKGSPTSNSPLPLNEFGLPPSLVSLNPYGYHPSPVNLSPYPYSSYPLIYDQYSGYNTNPYLPPFGYYPQPGLDLSTGSFGIQRKKQSGSKKMSKSQGEPISEPSDTPAGAASSNNGSASNGPASANNQQMNLSNIKNYDKQDKNIPDVPPPPLPSGAKNGDN